MFGNSLTKDIVILALLGLAMNYAPKTVGTLSLAFGAGMFLLHDKLLYARMVPQEGNAENPSRFNSPAEYGLDHEDMFIETGSSKVHGWCIKARYGSDSAPTLVFMHGNAGNIGHRLPLFNMLIQSLDVNVVAFDYRGYGDSSRIKPTQKGLIEDTHAVLDFLREKEGIDNTKLVPMGNSLGGAVAINSLAEYKNKDDIKGVILSNTFCSLNSMALKLLPFLSPFRWITRLILKLNLWESVVNIKNVGKDCSILMLSARSDEIVPPTEMDALFEASHQSRTKMFKFEGAHHNELFYEATAETMQSIGMFLNEKFGHHSPSFTNFHQLCPEGPFAEGLCSVEE
eukprot:TRINITY_DN24609_c0_g1_i1.p1 TRINITY_DN24609_c0_g1~~TRINITY_DN24609_c0_g1_i1.p1  ORF type:complete len:342 (+),score=95.65 TRINITY_DN24609_c0_g1_i1:120-1145(+)